MPQTHRIVPVFLTNEEASEIERLTGQSLDKALKGAVEFLLYYKVIKRCVKCDKEVEMLLPRDQSKFTLSVEAFDRPVCNVCNPKSKWRRVEDAE